MRGLGGADREPALGRLERLPHPTAVDQRVADARAWLVATAPQRALRELPRLQRHLATVERRVDLLALPRALRARERGEQARAEHQRADLVRDGTARGHRRATLEAGAPHHAAAAVAHHVDGPLGHARAERAPARALHDDDARVQRAQILEAEAQLLHHALAEVARHHVRGGRQPPRDRVALGVLQIEGDRALVAVVRQQEAAHPRLAAAGAARARLDLDHLGAHVGEQLGRVRTLLRDREVEDADPFERPAHATTPSARSAAIASGA